MSEVRLIVRDAARSACGSCHGSIADRLVAALSAEPQTIEELEAALERFLQPSGRSMFGRWSQFIDDEPWDAGLVVIDLAARLVVCESSYSSPGRKGYVDYHNGQCATRTRLRYHLSDHWKFRYAALGWQAEAEHRRRQREESPPLDARAILYGRDLVEFIAVVCLAGFQAASKELLAQAAERFQAQRRIDSGEVVPENPWDHHVHHVEGELALIRDVHARWLMTPRDDLRGSSPRELLLAKENYILWDMQDRCEQWSLLGQPPPALDPQSHAFRFGGIGRHEIVMYYELVRELIVSCWDRLLGLSLAAAPSASPRMLSRGDFLTQEVPRLGALRDTWLESPDPECHGRTPREVIDHERARMPEGMSAKEAMIDHDGPLCQMMEDLPGPMFWGLDGSGMDDEFAFSFHRTREEWDAQQREYEEMSRSWQERDAERKRLGVEYPRDGFADPESVWRRSFVSQADEAQQPLVMRLFSVGCLLAELTVDLKPHDEGRRWIDALNRDWGNLREVTQSTDPASAAALLEPVLDRFCDTLTDLGEAQNDLTDKCDDLSARLRRFLEPPSESDDEFDGVNDDDLPF